MTDKTIGPLQQRMIEDMSLRRFGEKTQKDYIRAVKNLALFLRRSPDTASNEDCAGSSCIWLNSAWVRRPSTPRSRRCGSSSP